MALISDRAATLSDFPQSLDSWTNYADGQGRASVTNAEILNRIEAAVLRTQEYTQRIVRVVESPSVTGDRRRVTIQTSVVITASGGGLDYYKYEVRLSEEQMALLNHTPFRAGNIIMANVQRIDGSGVHYRATLRPLPPDTLELTIDNLDSSGKVTSGTYQLHLTLIGA